MFNYKKARFTQEIIYFVCYLVVGLGSCVLAFLFVIEFFNPLLSKAADKPPQDSIVVKAVPKPNNPLSKNEPQNQNKPQNQNRVKDQSQSETSTPKPNNPLSKNEPQNQNKPQNQNRVKDQSQSETSTPKPNNPLSKNEPQNQNPNRKDETPYIQEIKSFMTPYIYDPENRRDPFEDPTIRKSLDQIVFVPKSPPEKYNLNQVKLRGIIWDIESPKALFQLPGETDFYTLLRGDKIGKTGTIFEIREDEVVIVESIIKASGITQFNETEIKIIKLNRLKL